ncbi:MAG: hypothetical protein IJ327_04875 [Lachnospiraceae bacterium]|nr:hypothetical protein [Lachnospiraceae bacterium]
MYSLERKLHLEMKKEDLVNALNKVQPSERLIEDTLLMMKGYSTETVGDGQRKNGFQMFQWKPSYYRWAGAVCACGLLLVAGVTLWGPGSASVQPDYSGTAREYRLAEESQPSGDVEIMKGELSAADGTQVSREQEATAVQGITEANGQVVNGQGITVQGTVLACRFLEMTDQVASAGITSHGILEISIREMTGQDESSEAADSLLQQETVSVYSGFT